MSSLFRFNVIIDMRGRDAEHARDRLSSVFSNLYEHGITDYEISSDEPEEVEEQ